VDYYVSIVFKTRSVDSSIVPSVCTASGLVASFYRRAMFPEYCSDVTMDDKVTYNTMVRVAGSFGSVALAFQAIMYNYNWTRVALLSDMSSSLGTVACMYGSLAIMNVLGSSVVIPIYMKSAALTPSDYFDYLDTVRKNARGMIYVCDLAVE
jgi:hypothetical protein